MNKDAAISECGKYRWWLLRDWSCRGFIREDFDPVVFVGLNPSVADHQQDDPTIRRCIRFASDWGFNALVMVNLLPIIQTDSKLVNNCLLPLEVMEVNKKEIYIQTKAASGNVVVCWGEHPRALELGKEVVQHWVYGQPKCLGLTKNKQPRHPLFVKASTTPEPYRLL